MRQRMRAGWGIFALVLGGLACGPARADDAGTALRKGQEEITFGGGYAFDLEIRDRPAVPFYTFVPGYGRFLSSRAEIAFELPFAIYHTWDDAVSVGLDVSLRYHFSRFGRFSPFFEVGAGGLWTNLDEPGLGGDFEFILNAGLGMRYELDRKQSVMLTGRFHHLSNGGLASPNRGINDLLVLFTYSRFLR